MLSRAFAGGHSRRGLNSFLGRLALGGTLGLIRLGGDDEALADSGTCKPKCLECKTCKKGSCKKVNGKVRCSKGKCKSKPNGSPCGGGTCQNGTCVVPFPTPPPFCSGKNFCPIATTPPACQASGAQCVCAAKEGGEPVCVLESSLHFESICSLCVTPGEICVDAAGCPGKIKACGLPCPTPL